MAVSTTRNRVIEGDDIDAQIAALPELTYLTRTNPDNPAIWETYNPITGEIVNTGTFAGGGDRGLLAASAPVLGLIASTVGLPGISGLLGSLTGATGSTLAGLTGATISGGTSAIAGGTPQDILNAALLGGVGAYGGSTLNNYLDTGSLVDPGITERQFAILDAQQLANQGLSPSQITDTLLAGGYNDVIIDRALSAITIPASSTVTPINTPITTPAIDTVNITGTSNPPINTGGLLSSLVTTPTNLPTVTVTAPSEPAPVVLPPLIPTVTSPTTPTVTVTAPRETPPVVLPPTIPTVTTPAVVTTPTTTTPTTDETPTTLGLTPTQILNILSSLGLFSAVTNPSTTSNTPIVSPTQLPPMYTDDYFTKVQQNYNRLLPAVPRDVASPLRDWYTSQYGA